MFGSRQKTVIEFVFAQSGAAGFYLSGGTALSAYYLNHRDSDDLDFFSEHDWVTIAEFQPVSIVRVDTDFFNRLVYSHQVTSSDGAFKTSVSHSSGPYASPLRWSVCRNPASWCSSQDLRS
ncbi:MAG: hypothetical protein DMG14_19585 [Acidobacteria bacterium]|nr:MAG: hypothetical protein DMG14_19585 [Acidobacteriota bacterium]